MSGHRIAYLQHHDAAWLDRERSFDAALLNLRRVRKPARDRLQFLLATTTDPNRIANAWEDFETIARRAEETYLIACDVAEKNYRSAISLADADRETTTEAARHDTHLPDTLNDEKLVVGEVAHTPGGVGKDSPDYGIERSVVGNIPEVGAIRH